MLSVVPANHDLQLRAQQRKGVTSLWLTHRAFDDEDVDDEDLSDGDNDYDGEKCRCLKLPSKATLSSANNSQGHVIINS